MINDLKKSIRSILYERISSPLSGALFFSWFVWNWKIPYILFYSDKGLNIEARLKIIQDNYIDLSDNLLFPIFSALFLVLVYPFASTGALNIWLRFKSWQTNMKNKIEETKSLSVEEANQIRYEMLIQEEKITNLLKSKEGEIDLYKLEIEKLDKTLKEKENIINDIKKPRPNQQTKGIENLQKQYKKEFDKLKTNSTMYDNFKLINKHIQNGNSFYQQVETDITGYYTSNNIIQRDENIPNSLVYNFTDKGEYFLKLWLDEKYTKNK